MPRLRPSNCHMLKAFFVAVVAMLFGLLPSFALLYYVSFIPIFLGVLVYWGLLELFNWQLFKTRFAADLGAHYYYFTVINFSVSIAGFVRVMIARQGFSSYVDILIFAFTVASGVILYQLVHKPYCNQSHEKS